MKKLSLTLLALVIINGFVKAQTEVIEEKKYALIFNNNSADFNPCLKVIRALL